MFNYGKIKEMMETGKGEIEITFGDLDDVMVRMGWPSEIDNITDGFVMQESVEAGVFCYTMHGDYMDYITYINFETLKYDENWERSSLLDTLIKITSIEVELPVEEEEEEEEEIKSNMEVLGIEIGELYDNENIIINNLKLNGWGLDYEKTKKASDSRVRILKNQNGEYVSIFVMKINDDVKICDIEF